jgi:hypothetical protein
MVGFLGGFGNKTAPPFRRGALDCSIADVSLTGHGKGCSAQIDAPHPWNIAGSTLYEQSESNAARDVNGV